MISQNLSLSELESFDPKSPLRGKKRRFACPLCGIGKPIDSPHRSLAVNTETGTFFCHRCQSKGLLQEFKNKSRLITPKFQRTKNKISTYFSIEKGSGKKVEKKDNLFEKNQKFQSEFINSPAEIYLLNRGISIAAATKAGCGFAGNWEHWERNSDLWRLKGVDKRVVFPIYNQNQNLVAIHGRAIDENYLDSPKITRGDKSEGLFLSDAEVLKNEIVAICEGAIDAMALAMCGIPSVAMTGTTPPDWFYRKMAFRNVILATDADDAGDKAAIKIKSELISRGSKVLRLRPKGSKDWGEVLEKFGEEKLQSFLKPFRTGLSDAERIEQAKLLIQLEKYQMAEFVAGLINDTEIKQIILYQLKKMTPKISSFE